MAGLCREILAWFAPALYEVKHYIGVPTQCYSLLAFYLVLRSYKALLLFMPTLVSY